MIGSLLGISVSQTTTSNSEKLLKSRIFDVERRSFLEGQKKIVRDVVVHPGAVAVLPVLENGQFAMIRNHRWTVGKQLLEIPAGTLEPHEDPIECAARELEEEAGYRAGRIEPLTEIFTSPGVLTERMWIYSAHELTKTRQNLQSDEKIVVDIMESVSLRRMICDGQIEDGKTVAALATWFLRCDSMAAKSRDRETTK
jgi:ADP-ribose pyrophosphatase